MTEPDGAPRAPEPESAATTSPNAPPAAPVPTPPQPAAPGVPPQYPVTPHSTPTGSSPPIPPQYPGTPPPPYPNTPPPPYPGTAGPPYPGPTPPPYPGTAAPPHPGPTPPPYPGAGHTAPPPHAPPALPSPSPFPDFTHHEHHISTAERRTHLTAQQRRTDATALGSLLLYAPNFLCSLLVMALLSLFIGGIGPVLLIAWLLSGLLVFHRPTESTIARRMLGLRHPTADEQAKLEPVWREVSRRAGVTAGTYELWIEDSDGLNAVAAAGHIVGVTRFALHQLPNGQLAAVLAHELGHHVGGHSWASLLGYWYALPGRLAWKFLRGCARIALRISAAFSCLGFVVLGATMLLFALVTISSLYGLPLLVLAAPYALAAVGRRAELRADQHAAALGFAPMLAAVLNQMHQAEQHAEQQAAQVARRTGKQVKESQLSKLLASHPDYYERLHHLQPWLTQHR